jgi:hypothetical protein
VGNYTSSIGTQLGNLDRQIKAYVRRMLLEFGKRFRARMNRERIGGNGSVLNVVTGKLKRSLRYSLVAAGNGFRLEAQIGGGRAPYATDHEDFGRLEFENTFKQEADKIMSEIQAGMEFFGRNPAAGPISGSVTEANEGGGDPGRAALLSELKSHFDKRRAAAKLRRQSKWRSMTRAA